MNVTTLSHCCHIVKVTSYVGEPNMLSAKTGDPLWRLVRKGVAPAFNPQNIRSSP